MWKGRGCPLNTSLSRGGQSQLELAVIQVEMEVLSGSESSLWDKSACWLFLKLDVGLSA